MTDFKPDAVNYYRIKSISKDGDIKFSSVGSILSACSNKNNVTLHENPISGNTFSGLLSLYKTQQVTINIFSTPGAKLFSNTSIKEAGTSTFSYSVSSLAKGLYWMQVKIGDDIFTKKIIVQ